MRRSLPSSFREAAPAKGDDDLGGGALPERVQGRRPHLGLFLLIGGLFVANLVYLESVSLPLPYLGGDRAVIGGDHIMTDTAPSASPSAGPSGDRAAWSPGQKGLPHPVVGASSAPPSPRPSMVPPPPAEKVCPPPPVVSPRPQEPVFRLRDIVVGLDWLANHPERGGAITAAQWTRLAALLPAMRGNFEGPPGRVDRDLETRTWKVLTDAQAREVRSYLAAPTGPADCMASLRSLEQRARSQGRR